MKNRGYLVPENIDPSLNRCVTFMLPDDLTFIGNFWGAVYELAKWTSYEWTGDDRGAQAAKVMAQVVDAARESFLTGCEGDAPLSPEIVEVVKYILLDNSDESEDCDDGDLAMCNCGKCGSAVYFDLESKKKYVMDAQCKRVYIEENETSPDLGGVEDWENAGQPPVPADLPVPHDNPLYQNNTEAQQCAKATAIVDEMWNLMSVYAAVEAGQTFSATVTALFAWAAVQFPSAVPANLAAAWASFITTAISALGLEAIVNEMEPIYENDAAKSDIICSIVSKMIPPEQVDFSWFGDTVSLPVKANTIYASDIKAAVDAFKVAFPDASITTKWINLFPLASWREIVTQKIPETLCGCTEYTPSDPTEGMGVISAYFAQALVNADFPDTIPAPEDFIASENPAGELIAATTAATTYLASTDNQGLSIMFAAPIGVLIKKLKFTAHWTSGAIETKEFDSGLAYAAEIDEDFGAISEGHVESLAIAAPDNVTDDLSAYSARFVWKNWSCYGTDESDENELQMSNIRFDLAAADGSWTRLNVPLGTYFQL